MIVNEAGNPPNVIFTMGCEIDNQKFTGVGRNKKDAKKHCAMEALKVNQINNLKRSGGTSVASSVA